MVYNILCNFMFIYVIIGIFSSYTFAPWTSYPVPPATGTTKSCFQWLLHHGFHGNYAENLQWALSRDRRYDQDVSYFAAAFAYLTTNAHGIMNMTDFGRVDFCRMNTLPIVNYQYITLKNAVFTCEGWIHLYLCTRNYPHNHFWVIHRDTSMDYEISLWAALYFQHIASQHWNEVTTPKGFCALMGKPVIDRELPENYPFMTLFESKMSCTDWDEIQNIPALKENLSITEQLKSMTMMPFTTLGTKLTCFAWICRWGFSNDSSRNYQIVISGSLDLNSVNIFTKNYIIYVTGRINEIQHPLQNQVLRQFQNLTINENINEMALQWQLEQQLQNLSVHNQIFLAPKEFCEEHNWSENVLYNYFGDVVSDIMYD